jgi:hypothetical protein
VALELCRSKAQKQIVEEGLEPRESSLSTKQHAVIHSHRVRDDLLVVEELFGTPHESVQIQGLILHQARHELGSTPRSNPQHTRHLEFEKGSLGGAPL